MTSLHEAPIDARLAAAGLPALPRSAWLELDLEALEGNLAAIRASVGAGVRVEPVVKADAYGHGALPITLALERAGADGVCVATFDEAMELRDGGSRLPILVLYPVPGEHLVEAAAHRVSVIVGDRELADRMVRLVAERATGVRSPLEVHVEVETGLGRGGLLPVDVPEVLARLAAAGGIRVAGVWSHLAAPEDPGSSSDQDAVFVRVLETIGRDPGRLAAGGAAPRRHLSASGALLTGSAPAYDAVRPGLATYGLLPDDVPLVPATGLGAALRPVMALHARPVRVAELPAGHGVGYGPAFTTRRPSRLATLPVGYGDGWARALSNGADALVRGTRVPLVGRVSMDAVIADVTDVPGGPIGVDDVFVLLGRQQGEAITAGDLARRRTTNSWEVVTAMSRRLPRVYHRAGVPEGMRTVAGWRAAWHGSSSGTGTSATSRSTRS